MLKLCCEITWQKKYRSINMMHWRKKVLKSAHARTTKTSSAISGTTYSAPLLAHLARWAYQMHDCDTTLTDHVIVTKQSA